MRHLPSFVTAAALALASLGLGGCGLHPLYAGGTQAGVAQGLSGIEVAAIPGRSGWLMHNALVDRLRAAGNGGGEDGSAPRYRLDVKLSDRLEGLGILSNDTVSRERRTLRARYQLVDVATGDILLDATAGSDAGIDAVSSEYATVAAEQTALENLTRMVADRIVINLAVQMRNGFAGHGAAGEHATPVPEPSTSASGSSQPHPQSQPNGQ